jgi:hypothetical protein
MRFAGADTMHLSVRKLLATAILSVSALSVSLPSFAIETRHTVTWFVEHEPELRAQIRDCRDDPGNPDIAPVCENAYQADVVLAAKKARESVDAAPPAGFHSWFVPPQALVRKGVK